MNPATDSGKKELTPNLRNKFTEYYVSEPEQIKDLEEIAISYLNHLGNSFVIPVEKIAKFYIEVKKENEGVFCDGAGYKVNYNMRSYCRFLMYIAKMTKIYGLERSLLDAASMAFLTQLDSNSSILMSNLIQKYLCQKNLKVAILHLL